MPRTRIYGVVPESSPVDSLRMRLDECISSAVNDGYNGLLIPQNLREVDPLILAAHIGERADGITPIVALQPSSTPPHTAAAAAAAVTAVTGAPIAFNMVAGAAGHEQLVIGDLLDHDARYRRMDEYLTVLIPLLRGETVTFSGEYYQYSGLQLTSRSASLAETKFFVAGSSEMSRRVALAHADVVVTHPEPIDDWSETFVTPMTADGFSGEMGLRVGLVVRSGSGDAWTAARSMYPLDPMSEQLTRLKTKSPNQWAKSLAIRAGEDDRPGAYWLGAFQSGLASAPFLVGSYSEVSHALAAYLSAGVRHLFVVENPDHDNSAVRAVVAMAEEAVDLDEV